MTRLVYDADGNETAEDEIVVDAEGVETTKDMLEIQAHHYIVEVPLAISVPSVESILVASITSGASVEITYPVDKQLSSPPLSGTFYINCYDTDGSMYSTRDIDFQSVTDKIVKNVLQEDCSFLSGKISVEQLTSTWSKKAMGFEFQVNFFGVAASLNQYELKSGIDVPLAGVDIVFDQSIVRPFGESLIWHVIPGDYFYTREILPQTKVTIDELPALCTGMACDYHYFEGESLITGFSIASGTQLTITGTGLGEPTKVEMG